MPAKPTPGRPGDRMEVSSPAGNVDNESIYHPTSSSTGHTGRDSSARATNPPPVRSTRTAAPPDGRSPTAPDAGAQPPQRLTSGRAPRRHHPATRPRALAHEIQLVRREQQIAVDRLQAHDQSRWDAAAGDLGRERAQPGRHGTDPLQPGGHDPRRISRGDRASHRRSRGRASRRCGGDTWRWHGCLLQGLRRQHLRCAPAGLGCAAGPCPTLRSDDRPA